MIKLLLLILIFSFNLWAKVSLELVVDSPSVKQGEIIHAKIIMMQSEGSSGLSSLNGAQFEKTLYLLKVSPFIGKQGQFESDVQAIFISVPNKNLVTEKINGEDVTLEWKEIEVIPTEQPKSFILGDFEIPARKKILFWIIVILCLLGILGGTYWIMKFFKQKKLAKNKSNLMRNEITSCNSYEDIVSMWKMKRKYTDYFPVIDPCFKNFEDVLFKYQFKSNRTQQEIDEVVLAYEKFKNEIATVLHEV